MFSEAGFSQLVKRSDGDDALAACVGARPNIPHRLFLVLLATASELVRSKLIAERNYARNEINHAVAMVADSLGNEVGANSTNYSAAEALVHSLNEFNQLNDSTILAFVEGRKFEETIVALAFMCNVSVDVVERTNDLRSNGDYASARQSSQVVMDHHESVTVVSCSAAAHLVRRDRAIFGEL